MLDGSGADGKGKKVTASKMNLKMDRGKRLRRPLCAGGALKSHAGRPMFVRYII